MRKPETALVASVLLSIILAGCPDVLGDAIRQDIAQKIDTSLSGLVLSAGTLSPAFAEGTTSYAATVGIASITVRPTASQTDRTLTVRLNGGSWNGTFSASDSTPLALEYGTNTVEVKVAISGGGSTTYTISVYRQNDNAELSALILDSLALVPGFDPSAMAYTIQVGATLGSVTVTPTPFDGSHASIETRLNKASGVDWQPMTGASTTLTLKLGSGNIIEIRVTAENGAQNTYTITLQSHNENAELSGLTISNIIGSLDFSPQTDNYEVRVPNSFVPSNSVVFIPTLVNASDCTIQLNAGGSDVWSTIASGSTSSPLPMSIGDNLVLLLVTYLTDASTNIYTVNVHRIDTESRLASLAFDEGSFDQAFDADTETGYTATLDTPSMTVKPSTQSRWATMQARANGGAWSDVAKGGQAALSLAYCDNAMEVKVTADDGTTTRTYTATVYRQSDNASLSGLALGAGSFTPAFAAGTTSYSMTVDYSVTATTLTATATPFSGQRSPSILQLSADGGATWGALATGSPTAPLSLGSGAHNILQVKVTAEDGTTVKTYSVDVYRNDPASLAVDIALDIPGEASFSWSDALPTIARGATMTVTATPSSVVSSYVWRVDGETLTGETSGTVTVGAGLPRGSHSLSVVVRVGTLLYSDTIYFTVN